MSSSGSRKENFLDEHVYVSTYEAPGVFTDAKIPYESSYQQYCKVALHTVHWKGTVVTKECLGG